MMMDRIISATVLLVFLCSMSSCISKKKFALMESQLTTANASLDEYYEDVNNCRIKLENCEEEVSSLRTKLSNAEQTLTIRSEQISDLKEQVTDNRSMRDKQFNQVEDLTSLNQQVNENINKTLSQLEQKDGFIQLLQAAKSRTDSINLALAVNLKGVLQDGIRDNDVEVKVDKTVVFVNLSDKMVYHSGSALLTPRAKEVLGKIAKIIESRPDLEVMVEGYTDNRPITKACYEDNWDLSVKRATAVVRTLQNQYNVDPNKLIAAGRGEYNTLASNETEEGRSLNRRTRIIILPRLDQFYDLLNPNNVPK